MGEKGPGFSLFPQTEYKVRLSLVLEERQGVAQSYPEVTMVYIFYWNLGKLYHSAFDLQDGLSFVF